MLPDSWGSSCPRYWVSSIEKSDPVSSANESWCSSCSCVCLCRSAPCSGEVSPVSMVLPNGTPLVLVVLPSSCCDRSVSSVSDTPLVHWLVGLPNVLLLRPVSLRISFRSCSTDVPSSRSFPPVYTKPPCSLSWWGSAKSRLHARQNHRSRLWGAPISDALIVPHSASYPP